MPSRLERVQSPSRRRLLAWVDGAAFLAGARLLVVEERLIERRQVLDQVRDLDLDAMHQRAAFEAVPIEGVELVVGARRLDHQPDRARRPLRPGAPMRPQPADLTPSGGASAE